MTNIQKIKFLFSHPKRIIPIVFLNKLGFQLQLNENIRDLCVGECIEIGAYSKPALLPYASSIKYADIHDAEEAKKVLEVRKNYRYHAHKFVNVDIFFKKNEPPLTSIEDESVDTVFSSQSLEHSPNPIAALIDYIRVLKKGGVVYTIIPNKDFTYDSKRKPTSINKLINKYLNNNWDYKLEEFEEMFKNTSGHDQYPDTSQESIIKTHKDDDGTHHVYCYDPSSALELIKFVLSQSNSSLILYDVVNRPNIEFAIRKL